jgi:hypothetical protein
MKVMAPRTMPAMTPPEKVEEELSFERGNELGDGDVDVEGVDAAEVVDAVLEILDDKATMPRNFCGILTTPTPLLQHAVLLSPQHHSVPSARPLHDVICMFPVGLRICSQILRQAPEVKLLSVQKFAKKLIFT